jgi:putative DNA primase/helicase
MTRRRDSIPHELTVRPRWVLWRFETVKGRLTKIPYRCNGRRASSTDPRTSASWADIQRAFDRGGFDGVGFVLNGDGLIGFDFDHCVDAEGNVNDPKIVMYFVRLSSYTEITPSGTGLRVFVFGKIPGADRKLGNCEIYETERYLTITGRRYVDAPLAISRRQHAIEAVYAEIFAERITQRASTVPPRVTSIMLASDADLLDRARRARNGERFSRLYDEGAWQADFPSQSEADLWLLARLMFWTRGDEARADRLFRQSKLMREKWNCESYREHTIERARE